MADAGWYPDAYDPNQQHYFDGQSWTGQYRPNPSAPSDETMRRGDLSAEQQWGQPEQQYGQPEQPWAQPDQQWAQPNQGHGSPPWQPGTPAPAGPRKNRKPLIVAGVAVVAVVAGLVTFLVWPSDDEPTITYEGKSISAAAETLATAEKSVDKAVSSRNGAKNDDTRCYFAKPKKPESGAKSSDVAGALRCGPVLFVDGVKTSAYLTVPFTSTTKGSSVELDVRDDLGDIEPAALDTSLDLVRPDGKTAPTENGGAGSLAVPEPKPAEKDLLTTATLTSADQVKPIGTRMLGRNVGVVLTRAGEIKRFGEGDDARSAPEGQRLFAFQLDYVEGDVDDSAQTAAMLVPSGGTAREIPDADGAKYVIAAVPTAGAAITLTDGGFTQSIALASGNPAANNIAVLQRSGRRISLVEQLNIPAALREGNRRGSTTFRARTTVASLNFWAPGNNTVRPTDPRNALLTVPLLYTRDGETYGFRPALLKLRLGNRFVTARNVAPAGKINNVFEVPWNFTSGVLQVSGSTVIDGVTVRITSPRQLPIRIPG